MNKVINLIFNIGLAAILLLGAACGKQAERMAAQAPAPAAEMAAAESMASDKIAGGAEQGLTEISEPTSNANPLRKYIAYHHNLTVETAADTMQASFEAALAHCEALQCQVLNANFNKATPYNPPSASLSLRVPPRQVEVFLQGLSKNAEIIQHGRNAEDKTNQVVDAEARIKNLTDYRNQLRVMLGDKSAKFKDLIEIQSALVDTQSELDTITSVRKILAQETDLVAVDINFSATAGITEQGFFAPVASALKNAGHVLMQSLATVITFIMGALPWLLIGVPLLILVRKFWVKIKAKIW